MSQHNGTVQAFDGRFDHGSVLRDDGAREIIPFAASQVEGLRSLSKGERVSFEWVQEDGGHCAGGVRRLIGDLEAYQDLGGLYS